MKEGKFMINFSILNRSVRAKHAQRLLHPIGSP